MIALHLMPIDRALGVQLNTAGESTFVAMTPMELVDGAWSSVSTAISIPISLLDSTHPGHRFEIEGLAMDVKGELAEFRFQGRPFGSCRLAGLEVTLDKAKRRALERIRAHEIIDKMPEVTNKLIASG